MYAGAKRVVASLWKVDDAATAEFMRRFYQNLLQKKLSSVAALKQTQNGNEANSALSLAVFLGWLYFAGRLEINGNFETADERRINADDF